MLSEYNIIRHVHYIHDIIWVILNEEVEDLQLYSSLICVFFLVLYYFNCHFLLGLMVKAFKCLQN